MSKYRGRGFGGTAHPNPPVGEHNALRTCLEKDLESAGIGGESAEVEAEGGVGGQRAGGAERPTPLADAMLA